MKRLADEELLKALGQRIREGRISRGMSQVRLSELCGITFQQIQKYEQGRNRVPIDRLASIAAAFGVTLEEMVRDIENENHSDADENSGRDTKRAVAVLKHFNRIEDPKLGGVVLRFIKELADSQHECAHGEALTPEELLANNDH